MMYDNAVTYVHHMLGSVLREGDVAVDATMGNGWDTALMADLVGASGTVYGFDIQSVALEVTKSRTSGSLADVRLHQLGHEKMSAAIDGPHHGNVKAVTFNLGYLPGGDKGITTVAETTLLGLNEARSVIAPDSVITVVCYRHVEGERELDVVRQELAQWPQDQFTVIEVDFINQAGRPPVVFVVTHRPKDPTTIRIE
jgi:hypothetical protein